MKEVAGLWGIAFQRECPGLVPAGSPERTAYRAVIEDAAGKYYVLEKVPSGAYPVKKRIIDALQFLVRAGMGRIPLYCADADGRHLKEHGGGVWQCAPFYAGEALDRSAYMYEQWRGDVVADFLLTLRNAAAGIDASVAEHPFSLKKYIYTLLTQVRQRRPDLMPRLEKVVQFLEKGFMPAYDALPLAFCHGDYHPLNIIWGKRDIRVVIDWEFCGLKPELYDAANMVGCLGMEHPSSLERDLVVTLIARLKASGISSVLSWEHFQGLVLALRFAWLSEWLRKNDEEMIALELDYMELLMEHEAFLHEKWMLGAK